MNGWQRLGTVLFIVWTIFILIFYWQTNRNSALSSADLAHTLCTYDNEKEGKSDDCTLLKEERYKEALRANIKSELWLLPLMIFFPIIVIGLFGVASLMLVNLFYWVASGFKPIDNANKKKQIIITCATLLSISILTLIFTSSKAALKESNFNKALSECKLEIITKDIRENDREAYFTSCMETKNFKRKYGKYCFDKWSAENYYCYE
jgi:hypothetical protein